MVQRHSPAVRYPLRRSRVLGCCWAGLLLLSGAVLLAWGCWGAGEGSARWLRWGVALLLWWVCMALGWQALRRQPLGGLYWNGAAWAWERADQTLILQTPVVVLDQQWLLVLILRDAQQQPQRFVLQRDWAPSAWADVRRAVYSSAHPSHAAFQQTP